MYNRNYNLLSQPLNDFASYISGSLKNNIHTIIKRTLAYCYKKPKRKQSTIK